MGTEPRALGYPTNQIHNTLGREKRLVYFGRCDTTNTCRIAEKSAFLIAATMRSCSSSACTSNDANERDYWDDYMEAYEDTLLTSAYSDGSLAARVRFRSLLTTAKKNPVERPHIRMPVRPSIAPTSCHRSGSTTSP